MPISLCASHLRGQILQSSLHAAETSGILHTQEEPLKKCAKHLGYEYLAPSFRFSALKTGSALKSQKTPVIYDIFCRYVRQTPQICVISSEGPKNLLNSGIFAFQTEKHRKYQCLMLQRYKTIVKTLFWYTQHHINPGKNKVWQIFDHGTGGACYRAAWIYDILYNILEQKQFGFASFKSSL